MEARGAAVALPEVSLWGVGDPGCGTHAPPALPLLPTLQGGAGVPGPGIQGLVEQGQRWWVDDGSQKHTVLPVPGRPSPARQCPDLLLADCFLIPVTSVHAHPGTHMHTETCIHTHAHARAGIYTCNCVLTDTYTCSAPAHVLPAHTRITCRRGARITPACACTLCAHTCTAPTGRTHYTHVHAHTRITQLTRATHTHTHYMHTCITQLTRATPTPTYTLHAHTRTLHAHVYHTDVTHSHACAYACTLHMHTCITQLCYTYYTRECAHTHYTRTHISHSCDMCLHAHTHTTCTHTYHTEI